MNMMFFKVLRSRFTKCQSPFIYVVKHGTIHLRIFSIRECKTCIGLIGPARMGLSFKSFVFETYGVITIL